MKRLLQNRFDLKGHIVAITFLDMEKRPAFKIQFSIVLALVLLFAPAFAFGVELILPEGMVGIIGYGSLISRESMSRTLGVPYKGEMQPVVVQGYKRDFSVIHTKHSIYEQEGEFGRKPDGIAYLNVRHNENARMHAVLFVVPRHALQGFDNREEIYDREKVDPHNLNVKVTGDVFIYVGKEANLIENFEGTVGVRKSYLDIVEDGLLHQSKDFANAYRATTEQPDYNRMSLLADKRRVGQEPLKCVVWFNK